MLGSLNGLNTLDSLRLQAIRILAVLNILWIPVVGYTTHYYEVGNYMALYATAILSVFSLVVSFKTPLSLTARGIAVITLMANISFQVFVAGYGDFQVDYHMFYFAMLAVTMIFMDWKTVAIGTVVIAVHHLSLNFLLPYAVFPEGSDLGRVILHAVAVLIEATVMGAFVYNIENILQRMSNSKDLVTGAIEHADLSVRFDVDGKDESAEFARMLNVFFEKMSEMIYTSKISMEKVSSAASHLRENATDLSGMSHNQEGNVNQLQEAMRHSTEQIYEINQVAEKSSKQTEEMTIATEKATSLMQGLKESALRIGDVTKVVLQISEQINLLSLNASIEAARAGDAGRGFAVVAGEVKKLADETNNSISQIQEVVKELNEMVEEASDSVGSVSNSVAVVGSDIQGVHLAIDQQNTAIQEVMSTIELFAQQISQLNESINISQDLVNELDSASDKVQSAVGAFKLGK